MGGGLSTEMAELAAAADFGHAQRATVRSQGTPGTDAFHLRPLIAVQLSLTGQR